MTTSRKNPDPTPSASWFVYLLECRGGRIYTGITNDLRGRWRAHRAGRGGRYTRAFAPRRMLAAWRVADRASAARLEARIKSMDADEKRRLAEAVRDVPGEDPADMPRRVENVELPGMPGAGDRDAH